jgi:hypothetical protein
MICRPKPYQKEMERKRRVLSCYISTFCGGRKLREKRRPRKAKMTRIVRGLVREVCRTARAREDSSCSFGGARKEMTGHQLWISKRAAEKRRESLYRILESVENERRSIENGQVTVLDNGKEIWRTMKRAKGEFCFY